MSRVVPKEIRKVPRVAPKEIRKEQEPTVSCFFCLLSSQSFFPPASSPASPPASTPRPSPIAPTLQSARGARTHATQAKNRSPARGALPALCTRVLLLDPDAPLQRVPGVPNGLPRKSAPSHIEQRLAVNGRETKPDPAFDFLFGLAARPAHRDPGAAATTQASDYRSRIKIHSFTQPGEEEKSLRAYKEKAEPPRPQPLTRARRPA